MTLTFSVVIPTRNRPDLLGRCLDRLAPGAQTLDAGRYEIVVADDSDDDTTRRLLGQHHTGVRWVAGPHRGPAANRNTGARLAQAPYLVFIDDDCVPDPGWLTGFLPTAAAGYELSPGRIVSRDPIRSPLEHVPLNSTGEAIWSANMLVRRDAFTSLGGFDERFPDAHMEDLDFQVRARARGLHERFSGDAVVDHPPRRLAWGGALGATHYGELLFAALRGTALSLPQVLRSIATTRIHALRAHPVSADTPGAIGSLVAELAHVIVHWRSWRARAAAAVRTPA